MDGDECAALAVAVRCAAQEKAEEAGEPEGGAEPVYGVKIINLLEGTAADEGLVLGDVIVRFNGTATPTFEALRDAVQ
jgi:S1-C subfamily serine protease